MDSDLLTFLHRATNFDRDSDKRKFVNNPTLEILRVTPRVKKAKIPMERPIPRDRETVVHEQDIVGLGALLAVFTCRTLAERSHDMTKISKLIN